MSDNNLFKRSRGFLFSTNKEFVQGIFKIIGIFEIVVMIVTRMSPMWTIPARRTRAANYFRIFVVFVEGQGRKF